MIHRALDWDPLPAEVLRRAVREMLVLARLEERRLRAAGGRGPLELCMAPLPAPAEKPSHRVSDSQSHAKPSPPAQVAVFCAALWPNLQPALTDAVLNRVCEVEQYP